MELRMTQAQIDDAIKLHAESPSDTLDIQPATRGYVLAIHFGGAEGNVEYIGIRIVPPNATSEEDLKAMLRK